MLKSKRLQRHKSIRRGMNGTDQRPRLTIFRSSQHIYAQIIDDTKHQTLLSESDLKAKAGTKTERARMVGEGIAKQALAKKITTIVFDRGGFRYQGRIAAVAEGARKGGLEF